MSTLQLLDPEQISALSEKQLEIILRNDSESHSEMDEFKKDYRRARSIVRSMTRGATFWRTPYHEELILIINKYPERYFYFKVLSRKPAKMDLLLEPDGEPVDMSLVYKNVKKRNTYSTPSLIHVGNPLLYLYENDYLFEHELVYRKTLEDMDIYGVFIKHGDTVFNIIPANPNLFICDPLMSKYLKEIKERKKAG